MSAEQKAVYKDTGISLYNGNPLIEALPSILSEEQAISALRRLPAWHEVDRTLPIHLRYHMLQQMQGLFIPLPHHIALEKKISVLIRSSYRARNPHDPAFKARTLHNLRGKEERGKEEQAIQIPPHLLAQGLDFTGDSGMGKSTTLKGILGLYPQVIVHSVYNGRRLALKQLTWLLLECSSNGGIKALATDFFRQVDELLKTQYLQRYGAGNADTMLMNMARVAAWQSLGVLVIDEVQNLSIAKSGGAEQLMNHVVRLRNEIGLPVVLVGTPEADPILSGKFRNARRGTGWGNVSWGRMSRRQGEWALFVRGLWRYQYTATPTLITREIEETLFDESQGISDMVVKVYMLAQMEAMLGHHKDPSEQITPGLIRSAARTGLAKCQPYLDALRRGDEAALRRMKDIYRDLADVTPRLSEVREGMGRERLLTVLTNEVLTAPSAGLEQVAAWLSEAGYSAEEALRLAMAAVETAGPGADASKLRRAAFQLAIGETESREKPTKEKPKKKKAPKQAPAAGSLLALVTEGRKAGKNGYESLKDAGLIRYEVGT